MEDFSPGNLPAGASQLVMNTCPPVIRSRTKSCPPGRPAPRARRPTGAPATVPCRPQRAPALPASGRGPPSGSGPGRQTAGGLSVDPGRQIILVGPGQAGPGLQFRPAVAILVGPKILINGHRGPQGVPDGTHGLIREGQLLPVPGKVPAESGPPGGPVSPQSGPGSE